MSDREAFEKWYKQSSGFHPHTMMSWNGEHYKYGYEIKAWELWQASRAQAIDDVRVGLSAIGIFDGNVFDVIDRLKEQP